MTEPTSPQRQPRKEVLRRRRRERQILVFGVLFIALSAIGVAAYAVYGGSAEGPFSEPFVTPAGDFESDVTLVCPPNGALPMEAAQVVVRSQNGTARAGIAGSNQEDLSGRGFTTVGATNASRAYEGTAKILFGEEGVVQAYTLATHFDGAELVLDSRPGTTVDVVLGDGYSELRPLYAPELDPEVPLSAPSQCLPADLVTAVPAPRLLPENPLESADPSASPEASESVEPEAGDPDEADVTD